MEIHHLLGSLGKGTVHDLNLTTKIPPPLSSELAEERLARKGEGWLPEPGLLSLLPCRWGFCEVATLIFFSF